MKYYIYSHIDIKEVEILDKIYIGLETSLRKKHKGKYYLWHFIKGIYIDNTPCPTQKIQYQNYKNELIQKFIADIYMSMILGRIDPNLKNQDNQFIFELDSNQESEEERLLTKIII